MIKSYHCPGCGAEFVLSDKKISEECLYCGSEITIIQKDISSLNVKRKIPFKISEKQARKFVDSSLGLFNFKTVKQVRKIYVPAFFTNYDVDYIADYSAEGDKGTFYGSKTISGKIHNRIIPITKMKTDSCLGSDLFSVDKIVDVDLSNIEEPIEFHFLSDSISDIVYKKTIDECHKVLRAEVNYIAITNEQCFVNNLKKDDFLTLLPFYAFTLNDSTTILVNGNSYQNLKKKNTNYFIWSIFFLVFFSYLISCFFDDLLIGAITFFILLVVFIIVFIKRFYGRFNKKCYYFDYKVH